MDSRSLEQQTHMTACNIAETDAVRLVSETDTLDGYLKQNTKPKYLILMYGPLHFRRHPPDWDVDTGSKLDALDYMLRFQPWQTRAHTLMLHPKAALYFARWVGRTELQADVSAVVDGLRRHTNALPQQAPRQEEYQQPDRISAKGWFSLPLPAQDRCRPWDTSQADHGEIKADRDWIAYLRARYADKADHVLVDLAPMANCQPYRAKIEQMLQGLHDNPFITHPPRFYAQPEYIHPTREGARALTSELAQQINAMEAGH